MYVINDARPFRFGAGLRMKSFYSLLQHCVSCEPHGNSGSAKAALKWSVPSWIWGQA